MNCREYLDLVQRHLDGAAAPVGAEGEAHLRDCPACTARAAAVARLTTGLRLLRPPTPPPALGKHVALAVVRDLRRRRMVRRVGLMASLAAAVLVALGIRQLLLAPAAPEIADGAGQPAIAVRDGRLEAPEPLRQTVEQAGQEVAALTSQTADRAVGGTSLLLPMWSGSSLVRLELPKPPDATLQPLREAGHGVSAGLEPVAASARRAMDLFWRDLPPMDGDGRGGF